MMVPKFGTVNRAQPSPTGPFTELPAIIKERDRLSTEDHPTATTERMPNAPPASHRIQLVRWSLVITMAALAVFVALSLSSGDAAADDDWVTWLDPVHSLSNLTGSSSNTQWYGHSNKVANDAQGQLRVDAGAHFEFYLKKNCIIADTDDYDNNDYSGTGQWINVTPTVESSGGYDYYYLSGAFEPDEWTYYGVRYIGGNNKYRIRTYPDAHEENDVRDDAIVFDEGEYSYLRALDTDWYRIKSKSWYDRSFSIELFDRAWNWGSSGPLRFQISREDGSIITSQTIAALGDMRIVDLPGTFIIEYYYVRIWPMVPDSECYYTVRIETQPTTDDIFDSGSGEYNNDFSWRATTVPLANNYWYRQNLKGFDDDWFKIYVPNGEYVQIMSIFNHTLGDLHITLYDYRYNETDPNNDRYILQKIWSKSPDEYINHRATYSGYHYFKVYPVYGWSKNSYDLAVCVIDTYPGGWYKDRFEPDDMPNATAVEIGEYPCLIMPSYLTINHTDDIADWFEVDLVDGYQVTLEVVTVDGEWHFENYWGGSCSGYDDFSLTLYYDHPVHGLVEKAAADEFSQESVGENYEAINYNVPDGEGGTYYLEVEVSETRQDRDGYHLTVFYDDRFEENDIDTDAAFISTVQNYHRSYPKCVSADDDWYEFELEAEHRLTLSLDFVHAQGDVDMLLYNLGGALIDWSDSITDAEEIVYSPAAPNRVRAQVILFDEWLENNLRYDQWTVYDLIVDLDDIYEENDILADAHPLSIGAYHHLICKDDDWYRVTLDDEYLYCDLSFSHADGDLDVAIYDSSHSLVDHARSTTDDESLRSSTPLSGEYFIRVYKKGVGDDNTYDLVWWKDDRFEENDAQPDAYHLDADEYVSDDLWCIDDDLYCIEDMVDGEELSITISFTHADGDLDLRLLDAAGNTLVASVSDTDDDEHIDYHITTDGDYTIYVYGWAGAENRYDLDIERILPLPPDPPVITETHCDGEYFAEKPDEDEYPWYTNSDNTPFFHWDKPDFEGAGIDHYEYAVFTVDDHRFYPLSGWQSVGDDSAHIDFDFADHLPAGLPDHWQYNNTYAQRYYFAFRSVDILDQRSETVYVAMSIDHVNTPPGVHPHVALYTMVEDRSVDYGESFDLTTGPDGMWDLEDHAYWEVAGRPGETASYDGLFYDGDPTEPALQYDWAYADPAETHIDVFYDPATKRLRFESNTPNWYGQEGVRLTATDSHGETASTIILIRVVETNDDPYVELQWPPDGALLDDTTPTFRWTGYDVDAIVPASDALQPDSYDETLEYHLFLDTAHLAPGWEEPTAVDLYRYLGQYPKGTPQQCDIGSEGVELAERTLYYWKVVATDPRGGQSTTMGAWSFRTGERARCDLVVKDIAPRAALAGDQLAFSASVHNIGDADLAAGTRLEVHWTLDDATGGATENHISHIALDGPLAVDGHCTVSWPRAPLARGEYELACTVVPEAGVDEYIGHNATDTNNRAALTVAVIDRPLYQTPSFSPMLTTVFFVLLFIAALAAVATRRQED